MLPSSSNASHSSVIHFGGPDRPARALRDVLARHVAAVPAGGAIHWATYYFRDLALADALVAAHRRGVAVRIAMEGAPRMAGANDAVIALLEAGLDAASLRVLRPRKGLLAKAHPHLHSKVYAFTHPQPIAFVGSFNPSGNDPEDPRVIAEIGDQDRGHNLLVGYRDTAVVDRLVQQVATLMRGAAALRMLPTQNRVLRTPETELRFFPRLRSSPIERDLALHGGGRILAAISHMKTGPFMDSLCAAASRGCEVQLIVHDTERRVPEVAIDRARAAGIAIRRYVHPDRLPLHAKMLLVEDDTRRRAWFGSFNFNPRSRFLNHELLVRSTDPAIFGALSARLDEIAAEAELAR